MQAVGEGPATTVTISGTGFERVKLRKNDRTEYSKSHADRLTFTVPSLQPVTRKSPVECIELMVFSWAVQQHNTHACTSITFYCTDKDSERECAQKKFCLRGVCKNTSVHVNVCMHLLCMTVCER